MSNISKALFSTMFFNSLNECMNVLWWRELYFSWCMTSNINNFSFVSSFLSGISFVTSRHNFKIERKTELKGTGEFKVNYSPVSCSILKHDAILRAMHNQIQPPSLETTQEGYNCSLWRQQNASYWWFYTFWKVS